MSRSLVLVALLALVPACASLPTASPEELGASVVAALDRDDRGRADALFDDVEDDAAYRERVYPIVYAAARERFESGDAAAAARQLRFLADAYPDASQSRLALAYALFLQRAQTPAPSAELTAELAGAVRAVRADGAGGGWVDLIDAQRAIDADELDAARGAYDRFLASWDGSPAHMAVYVEDVGRYLASH